MLTEPFEIDSKKNWTQLSEIVKETYRKVNESINKSPFSFKIANLFNSNQEQIGLRFYCLGPVNNSSEFTLAYCDILNNENIQFNQNQGILINNPLNQNSINTGDDLNIEDNLDNLNLPNFQWKELLIQSDSNLKDNESNQKLSKEELIQLERKRMLVTGISSYEFHEQQKRFVFSLDGSLHYIDDNGQAPYIPIKLPSNVKGAKINPTICPSNPNLIAYVCENDLFVLNIKTSFELQLTNCKLDYPNSKIIAGLPSFIIQEEFGRFVGYWWQPSNTLTPDQYTILFEQVDETEVEELKISTFDGSTEDYRYPRPGTKNAISILKLAKFKLNEFNEIQDLNINYLNGIDDFKQIYSEYEYLTNCNWYTEDSIVIHLLNRKQKNLVLFLISTENKFPNQIIHEEINTDYWVNITQVLEFLDQDQHQIDINKELSFIWGSQESGFRHLYKYTVKLIEESNSEFNSINLLRSKLIQKKQLTSGKWEVNDQSVWLDSKNNLVYFIGLKDSPLERQLYVLSLNNEFETIKRLTTSGYSNALVVFNSKHSAFINILSNISKPPFGFINLIQNSNTELPSIHRVGYILRNKLIKPDGSVVDCIEQFEQMPGFSRPELFSYQLKDSGDIVYGLIYKPHFMQADKKYPVLLEVYGGPATSLISNTFRSVRLFSRHILASQGYVVCVFDCRGSSNRGIAFEGHLYKQLGQVEVNDQVEVLQWLASNTNYIDLNRIAVHGFSYGGYLSLLFYAKRPDIFRLCLAGAPVTNWELYDTAYTERYMDTPENNKHGYAQGSVLNHVCNFPNEENRLLLIHGLNDENVFFNNTVELINELVKAGKPYDLLVYPNERHCLGRDPQSRMHLETAILSYLNKNL